MNDVISKYEQRRNALLTDATICDENRSLFRRFFEYQEHKLKRCNGLPALDVSCIRTLDTYIFRFRNVNRWFGNKPLSQITEREMRAVYDGLEEGKLLSARGTPFRNRHDYYRKVFKSKLFKLAGKDALARQVIEFSIRPRPRVRFVREEGVLRVVQNIHQLRHRLLFWLEWDIGENINSMRHTVKEDFTRRLNKLTGEPEYLVRLRPEILKRSRTPRTEITNYRQTVSLLDEYLPTLQPGQRLFEFSYDAAQEVLARAAERAEVRCEPDGQPVTWKDLRSSMACHLLSKGWTREQINARLGHTPSSAEIDKYINFLALDRETPKAKIHEVEMDKLREELSTSQSQHRATASELRAVSDRLHFFEARLSDLAERLSQRFDLKDVEQTLVMLNDR